MLFSVECFCFKFKAVLCRPLVWEGEIPIAHFTIRQLFIVHCTLRCTQYTVHSNMYTLESTLYPVHCTLYTINGVHWPLMSSLCLGERLPTGWGRGVWPSTAGGTSVLYRLSKMYGNIFGLFRYILGSIYSIYSHICIYKLQIFLSNRPKKKKRKNIISFDKSK